jgi:hypothetical protein
MSFLSFALADLLVLIGAGAATWALAPGGRLDRTLALVTLGITQVVVSMLVPGALLSELTRAAVLVTNAVIAVLLVLLATWRNGGRLPMPKLPAAGAVRAGARRVPGLVRAHPWCAFLVALAGAEFVWRAFAGYLLPPYGYDALWYHLTSVSGWLQDGKIGLSPFDFRSRNFPANGELTFAWVALFLRSDTWVNVVQLLFAAAGSLAVAGIARTVGLRRASAIAAGALFFLTPTVLTQATTDYVDVIFASTFLLSLHFLFRYLAGPPPADLSSTTPLIRAENHAGVGSTLLLAGLAAGFALGAKRTGAVDCGVAVGALAITLALRRGNGSLSWRGLTARLAIFVIPLVVVGSYWSARNWAHYGDPVYPAEVTVLGHQLFAGPKTASEVYGSEPTAHPWFIQTPLSWWHDVAPWTHDKADEYYRFDQRPGGLGATFTVLELPALVLLAIIALRRDRRLLNLLVPVVVIFLLQPNKWWSRHTLLLAAIGAVALVYFAERWAGRPIGNGLRLATLPLLAISLWFSTAGIEIGGGMFGGPPYLWAPKVVSLVDSPPARSPAWVLGMPAYSFLDSAPRGSRIGVGIGATPFYSPLYGSHYQNRVYALRASEASQLGSTVTADRIDYLFLRRGSPLDRRAREDFSGLRTIYADAHVRVYRLE